METKEIVKSECNSDNILTNETKNNKNGFDKQKRVIVTLLLAAMLMSIFVAPFIVDKLHIIEKTQETLDSKKDNVVAVTATAATVSVAIAAMPGDSTTPLANQIAELDIFFIIVLTAIYLLKVLLVASTSLSFKLLIPIACLLGLVYYISNKNYLKNLAFKILSFGLVVFLTVPISVAIMNVVDTTLRTQEKVETITIEETNSSELKKNSDAEKNWWDNFWNDVTTTVTEVTDTVVNTTKEMFQQAKNAFSNLVDIVASLVITCCMIPLLVILFLVWVLKVLFGINIPIKKAYNGTHKVLKNALTKKTVDNENEI